jgi:hypothetical protein
MDPAQQFDVSDCDHALFDRDATGQMLVSDEVDQSSRVMLGLSKARLRRTPSDEERDFLRHHREHLFGTTVIPSANGNG